MDTGGWIGIAGIVLGCGIAYWQWYDARAKGGQLVAFLHGLKTASLPPEVIEQIDDQLARLDPPKRQATVKPTRK